MGATLGTLAVSAVGDRIRNHPPTPLAKAATRHRGVLYRIWARYGWPGLGLAAPLFVGAPLGTAIEIILGCADWPSAAVDDAGHRFLERRANVRGNGGVKHDSALNDFSSERSRECIAAHEHLTDFVAMFLFLFGNLFKQCGDIGIIRRHCPYLLHQLGGAMTFLVKILQKMLPTTLLG